MNSKHFEACHTELSNSKGKSFLEDCAFSYQRGLDDGETAADAINTNVICSKKKELEEQIQSSPFLKQRKNEEEIFFIESTPRAIAPVFQRLEASRCHIAVLCRPFFPVQIQQGMHQSHFCFSPLINRSPHPRHSRPAVSSIYSC